MIIQGRNSAVVYADRIDRETKLAELLRKEAFANSKIRIMSDAHCGKNAVVGTTMTLHGRVTPSLLGRALWTRAPWRTSRRKKFLTQ